MKISYRWLQDYVKTTLPPEVLGEKFRMTSSELEDISYWGSRLKGVVIGKVLELSQHPNADRLRVALVDLGNKNATIVCGGRNLATEQTVLVATPGTTLFPTKGDPIIINTTKLRGVTSEGMICAPEEVGISLPNEGIWVLDGEHKPGTPAAQALQLDDWVLDLEITPNRADLLSYTGLAREVAAFDKKQLFQPPIATLEDSNQISPRLIFVEVSDPRHCERYSSLCLENVEVKSSPWWLQARLLLSGIRPINTVVDVGNYVMLELGQPLHAFALDKLPKSSKNHYKVTVRDAENGEKITLLDDTTRALAKGDIVICDAENKVIALAGIMGDKSTSISSSTTRIFLESATFDGPQIRRTSRRLGLRSEASSRFEKGLDPEMTVTALKRAAYLLHEIAGATISSQVTDHSSHIRAPRQRIHLSFDKIQQVLGVHISCPETKSILQRLGFQIPLLNKSSFETIPPSWRKDVILPEDVIEELVRIWGYERIPATLPSGLIKPPFPNRNFEQMNVLRRSCAVSGSYECIHLPFVSANVLEKTKISLVNAIRLPNPLSQETEYLTPSHLTAFLQNISGPNLQQEELSLFEIGKVFSPPTNEVQHFSLLLRTDKDPEKLYSRAKTVLEKACRELHIACPIYQPATSPSTYFNQDSALSILLDKKPIGEFGLINTEIVNNFKIRRGKFILFLEMELKPFLDQPDQVTKYRPAPLYPSIERDLTLILDQTQQIAGVMATLDKALNAEITLDWRVENVYTGKPLPDGKKSVTIHFTYNSAAQTLEDELVNKDQKRLIKICQEKLSATINP